MATSTCCSAPGCCSTTATASFSDGSVAANVPVLADTGLKLVDVDLDGDLDLVHHASDATRLFRNAGGVLDGGEIVDAATAPAVGRGLNACDINGDGFEDVIIARNTVASPGGTPRTLLNVDGDLVLSAVQRGTPANPDSLLSSNFARGLRRPGQRRDDRRSLALGRLTGRCGCCAAPRR